MTEPLKLFEEVACASAGDLLDALSPQRGTQLHDRAPTEWIFRGQEEAFWSLVPSAFRHEPFLQFKDAQVTEGGRVFGVQEQIANETQVVDEFTGRVDEAGLEVPYDSPRLRSIDGSRGEHRDGRWFPARERLGMYALAQHYGIPTRLLDWTWDAHVAAYFSASGSARRAMYGKPVDRSDNRFSVWALDADFLRTPHVGQWDPKPVLVTVPTKSNPNLAAQRGLFTLVMYREVVPADATLPTIDALLQLPTHESEAANVEGLSSLPHLYKFTLPQAEAGKLLYFLFELGVDAASVYPGHASIVAAMREGKLREVVRPRS